MDRTSLTFISTSLMNRVVFLQEYNCPNDKKKGGTSLCAQHATGESIQSPSIAVWKPGSRHLKSPISFSDREAQRALQRFPLALLPSAEHPAHPRDLSYHPSVANDNKTHTGRFQKQQSRVLWHLENKTEMTSSDRSLTSHPHRVTARAIQALHSAQTYFLAIILAP